MLDYQRQLRGTYVATKCFRSTYPLLLNRENKEVHNIFYELLQYGSKSMHREWLTDNCISLRETHIKTKTKNLKSSTHLIEKEHTIDRYQESGAPFTQKKISKRSVEGCRSYYHQGNPHQNSHSQETAGECDWFWNLTFEHPFFLGRQEVASSNMHELWNRCDTIQILMVPWHHTMNQRFLCLCLWILVLVKSYRLLLRHLTKVTVPPIEEEYSSYDGSSNMFCWCFEWWWLNYQEDQGWKAVATRTTSWHARIHLETQEGRHVWNMNTRLVFDFSGMRKMKTILV